MPADRDPLDMFSALDPVAELSDRDILNDPSTRSMLERIVSTDPATIAPVGAARMRARRGLQRRWIGIGGGVIAATALAAWAAIRNETVSDVRTVACYAEAATDADIVQLRLGDGDNPIDVCRPAFTNAMFDTVTSTPDTLVACVLPSGVAAVIPGAMTDCDQLGWARSQPGDTSDADAFSELQRRLVDNTLDRCPTTLELVDLIERTSADLSLDITIRTERDPQAGECQGFGLEPDGQTVFLAPYPASPGG
jgi:hypothetical protein